MPRKRKRTTPSKTLRTSMRFDPDLMRRLSVVAVREGRSRANLVDHILRQALKVREKEVGDASIFE